MPAFADCHLHLYPETVARDPKAWAETHGEAHWWQLKQSPRQGWQDAPAADALLAALGGTGVVQGWYWQTPAAARAQIEWTRAWMAATPARLCFCAPLVPDPTEALPAAQAAKTAGFVGLGEVFPAAQGFAMHAPWWLEVCAWAEAADFPILLHVPEAAGADYPGRIGADLMDYVGLAEQFPRLRLIFAHWGGGLPFFLHHRRVRRALANVWFDSAASPLLYDAGVWRTVAHLAGPQKLLYGSDWPLACDRPRGSGWALDSLLRELDQSGLDADAQARMREGNLAEFFPDWVPTGAP